jgi:hypothetical protein
MLFGFSGFTSAENFQNDSTVLFPFLKKELNTGFSYKLQQEREQQLTDNSNYLEELTTNSLLFQWSNRNWKYLVFRQESWNYTFEAGPFIGNGTLIDSTETEFIDADQDIIGLRTRAAANYASRFYYDFKNYTIVKVNAWGRFDFYRQNSDGMRTDSLQVSTPFSEETDEAKFRYGFEASAGWGRGRLNPMNHFMVAEYLLKNNYKRRNFSDEEIARLAVEIGKIKHSRDARLGHNAEVEAEQLKAFINQHMLLEAPVSILADWEMGEFMPRMNGTRVELGPFFNYYNREPDFIYGGYLKIEHEKYCNLNWNRLLKASLSYNSDKTLDWLLLETELGWSFYPNLRNRYDFGLKYVPGLTVNGLDDVGAVRHNFVPYVNYYSQLNSKYRMDLAFSWRISEKEKFMIPGPEVSVSFYRSRY